MAGRATSVSALSSGGGGQSSLSGGGGRSSLFADGWRSSLFADDWRTSLFADLVPRLSRLRSLDFERDRDFLSLLSLRSLSVPDFFFSPDTDLFLSAPLFLPEGDRFLSFFAERERLPERDLLSVLLFLPLPDGDRLPPPLSFFFEFERRPRERERLRSRPPESAGFRP